ncbi:MAG TPA: hypothetical protein VEQ37_14360 [Actinomycetota bacterium]|nr:hypothetical protein [Actinomycetota bacterium]
MSSTVDALFEKAADATEAARSYLASEQGRRLRRQIAIVVIVGAPLFSELPVIRRSPMARLLRTAAVGTLLIKGAEWFRDWEPQPGFPETLSRSAVASSTKPSTLE